MECRTDGMRKNLLLFLYEKIRQQVAKQPAPGNTHVRIGSNGTGTCIATDQGIIQVTAGCPGKGKNPDKHKVLCPGEIPGQELLFLLPRIRLFDRFFSFHIGQV